MCTVSEFVGGKFQEDVNSDEDDSWEVISPSFKKTLNSTETPRKNFMKENTFFELILITLEQNSKTSSTWSNA